MTGGYLTPADYQEQIHSPIVRTFYLVECEDCKQMADLMYSPPERYICTDCKWKREKKETVDEFLSRRLHELLETA